MIVSSRRALLAAVPALLAPSALRAAGRTLVATVALRLVEDYPMVPASLAGQSVVFLLDTGAQGTLVVPEIVAALSLPLRGMAPIDGTGGVREARVVLLPGLRLGGVPLPDTLAPVLPVPVGFRTEPPFAGLLGALSLSVFDLLIDVPGGSVSLFLPGDGPAPFAGTVVPLEVTRQGEPYLPVRVNGRRLLALLDTGTRATIIDEAVLRDLGVAVPPASANVAVGVDGTRRALGHTRVRLGLGDEPAREVPVSVSALRLDRGEMLLGLDALRQRRVFIAYAKGEATFAPIVGV